MGFRNPFRFSIDPANGWVYLADYGPDRNPPTTNRGPEGLVELNVIKTARQLRLAVLPRRQPALRAVQPGHRRRRRQVQLQRAGQQLAQQHRPDQPASRSSPPTCGTATAPRRTSRSSAPAAPAPMGGPVYRYDPANPSADEVPGLLRRRALLLRVVAQLRQGGALRLRHGGDPHQPVPARAAGSTSRWTWSSARTARSTCWSGAPTSVAATATPGSTGSTTSRAAGPRSPRPPARPPAASPR